MPEQQRPGKLSGWHSNDAESEFSVLKHFVRARYGKLLTRHWGPDDCGNLWEWFLRVNLPDHSFL